MRRYIPQLIENSARSVELRLNRMGHQKRCYICKKTFSHFYPFRGGSKACSAFIRELRMIGSDVDNFRCPQCGCHDRERHLFMYFDRLELWNAIANSTILHFAAERSLRQTILNLRPKEYILADLHPRREEVKKIDVTSIPYPDEYFDFVICNHVLEHVSDDRRAMSELRRVLRRGQQGVVQTPFSSLLANTFEDRNINTDVLRCRYYGQEDHVRVYGHDLFTRLEDAGFVASVHKHDVVLSDLDSTIYGVNPREDLILVTGK